MVSTKAMNPCLVCGTPTDRDQSYRGGGYGALCSDDCFRAREWVEDHDTLNGPMVAAESLVKLLRTVREEERQRRESAEEKCIGAEDCKSDSAGAYHLCPDHLSVLFDALKDAQRRERPQRIPDPHVTVVDLDGEMCFEWWRGVEKFTLYAQPGEVLYTGPSNTPTDATHSQLMAWLREGRAPCARVAEVVDGECMQDCDAVGVPCPKRSKGGTSMRAADEKPDPVEPATVMAGTRSNDQPHEGRAGHQGPVGAESPSGTASATGDPAPRSGTDRAPLGLGSYEAQELKYAPGIRRELCAWLRDNGHGAAAEAIEVRHGDAHSSRVATPEVHNLWSNPKRPDLNDPRLAELKDRLEELCPLWVVVAWLWDRREQYKPSSGTYAAFDELIGAAADAAHLEAWKHGELDDLREDAERCINRPGRRTAKDQPKGGQRT